jgi:predicted hotdog family 3-hydroxylacyl-ACP dehydratase
MFPPIEELVPHTGAMVLLDAMTAWRSGYARCIGKVRAGAPFVRDDTVESVVTIEYMAQAVAACLGYEALVSGGGVRVGMIIGCKRFEAHADTLRVHDEFSIDVQCVQGNDTLSHFDCHLQRGSERFSEAVLTLYHASQFPGAGAGGTNT